MFSGDIMSLGHPDRSVLVAFRWSMQCLLSILSVLPWLVSLKNEYVCVYVYRYRCM